MLPGLFITLLVATLAYAFLRGTSEHRIAAAGCLAATIASRLLRSPIDERYGQIEIGVLGVDIALFMLFLAIALRSQRFWPLWVSGFHLVAVAAHLMRALKTDLIPSAYGVAAQFWSYPVLLCIGIAVWRSRQRILKRNDAGNLPPAAI